MKYKVQIRFLESKKLKKADRHINFDAQNNSQNRKHEHAKPTDHQNYFLNHKKLI